MKSIEIHFKRQWWGWKRPMIEVEGHAFSLDRKTNILTVTFAEDGILRAKFRHVERICRTQEQWMTDVRIYELEERFGNLDHEKWSKYLDQFS